MPSLFKHKRVTVILEHLFRKVLTLPEQPTHTDDVADYLDVVSDDDLAMICQDGDTALRSRIEVDLIELELEMEDSDPGWLIELLGEGKVPQDGEEEAPLVLKAAED